MSPALRAPVLHRHDDPLHGILVRLDLRVEANSADDMARSRKEVNRI
jgi:hypothetical protein